MTSIEFHTMQRQMRARLLSAITRRATETAKALFRAIADWRRRRLDRAAFLQLLDREEWIYEDIGISRADVEWAAHLPRRVNAAKELEKLRAFSMMGR